jgi:hypothetical protein
MLQRGGRRAELARRHGSESVSEPTLEAVGEIAILHNVKCSDFIAFLSVCRTDFRIAWLIDFFEKSKGGQKYVAENTA